MGQRVLTAMSGGVDSAAAALLLRRQGIETDGATMRLITDDLIGATVTKAACTADAVNDAKRVCERLGIQHYVFDMFDEFRRNVIDRFADSYMRGETPNPCIDCNRYMKFSRFLQEADTLGYTHIATGHYARIEYDSGSKRWLIKKAVDDSKDQSYVLYTLSQDILSRTLLPLGGMRKTDIRALAEEHGFVNANKPDSQDICFVPDGDYAGFLENVLGKRCPSGEFVREDGGVVGQHKGLHRYTIGQRKGLGIAAEKPLYVVQKDKRTNRVILGDNTSLFTDTLVARDINWIATGDVTSSIRVTAKTRYKQAETPATVSPLDSGNYLVRFDSPQRAVTAGQAVVFYDGDTVVGGGTIQSEE